MSVRRASLSSAYNGVGGLKDSQHSNTQGTRWCRQFFFSSPTGVSWTAAPLLQFSLRQAESSWQTLARPAPPVWAQACTALSSALLSSALLSSGAGTANTGSQNGGGSKTGRSVDYLHISTGGGSRRAFSFKDKLGFLKVEPNWSKFLFRFFFPLVLHEISSLPAVYH